MLLSFEPTDSNAIVNVLCFSNFKKLVLVPVQPG